MIPYPNKKYRGAPGDHPAPMSADCSGRPKNLRNVKKRVRERIPAARSMWYRGYMNKDLQEAVRMYAVENHKTVSAALLDKSNGKLRGKRRVG